MPRATRTTSKQPSRASSRATKTATKGTSKRASARSSKAATPARRATSKTAKTAAPAKSAARTKRVATKPARKATPVRGLTKATKPAPKPAKAPPRKPEDKKFVREQRALLLAERETYTQQAEALKAEAEQLAEEMEPGDIQFDEESGEGGTMNVERERDLALSAQAQAAVEEIDRALARISAHTYGYCEQCGQPIPKARLKALPYASLCVQCKSGGLSRR